MALKCSFKAQFGRVYMFFGTRNPNLTSILKPEVELMVFLRMRSNKITKTPKHVFKLQFEGLISHVYMCFGTGNPNLKSILIPEVVSTVFLRMRMRNNKITKKRRKCP